MASLKLARQWFKYTVTPHKFNGVLSSFNLVEASPGKIKAEYVVLEEHTNPGSTLHGGFTATAVDGLTSLALLTIENARPGVSLNLNVNYLKALKIGEKVTFEADVIRQGRSVAYMTANVFTEKGDLAAHGTHLKHLGN